MTHLFVTNPIMLGEWYLAAEKGSLHWMAVSREAHLGELKEKTSLSRGTSW